MMKPAPKPSATNVKLRQQKRKQIISELRTNAALISVSEKTAYLLASHKFQMSPEEKDSIVRLMNQSLFDEVSEERASANLCSNLKCANFIIKGPLSMKTF